LEEHHYLVSLATEPRFTEGFTGRRAGKIRAVIYACHRLYTERNRLAARRSPKLARRIVNEFLFRE
jgi:hypothetical protein